MSLRVLMAVVGVPWAIDQTKGWAICQFLADRAVSGRYSEAEIDAILAENAGKVHPAKERSIQGADGAVAVIPIQGVMAQHMSLLGRMSGGSSTDAIGRQVSAAAGDPNVKAIVLHVESPGGSTYGLPELADRIFEARSAKPVIAHVDSYAASAAYWVASQATEVVASPGGDVGSIGVYALHDDYSKALEKAAVKRTMVYAGKYKVEGNPAEPLSEEGRDAMQQRVDAAYKDFLTAVARGRDTDVDTVAETYGEGRMVRATDALKRGMVDRIATFEETIKRFAGPPSRTRERALELKRLEIAELS